MKIQNEKTLCACMSMISEYTMETWRREGGKKEKKKKNPYTSCCCCCCTTTTTTTQILTQQEGRLNRKSKDRRREMEGLGQVEEVDILDPHGDFIVEEDEAADSDDEEGGFESEQGPAFSSWLQHGGSLSPSSLRHFELEECEGEQQMGAHAKGDSFGSNTRVCHEPGCSRKATHSWSMDQEPSRCDAHLFEGMK